MRLLLCAVLTCLSASVADAGTRCPPGSYAARYSFGIWICKQVWPPRLACPPGQHLFEDHWGTPKCVKKLPRLIERR
jgi:hypothetical protein